MPELPEVRAEAARIEERLAGQTLVSFRPLSMTALKTFSPPYAAAHGEQLTTASARGKWILLHFPSLDFVVHLMQGGRLRRDTKPSARPRGGLARWAFENADALLLTEMGKEHRAGVWTSEPGSLIDLMSDLGPDADSVGFDEFDSAMRSRSGRIHNRLRDQTAIAGVGRRLANEICFRAKVSPFLTTRTMDSETSHKVWESMRDAIADSVDFESSQVEMVSSDRRRSLVHRREGQPCPVCADEIRTVKYVTHTVFYCANCQTGGDILADNTTSKFLK